MTRQMKSQLLRLAVFTLLLGGPLACRQQPATPPRPEAQLRTERLVVDFIQAWRREMAAATVPGSPLFSVQYGSAVSEERMRTVAESLAVFQDMRSVCGSNKTREEGNFNTFFSPLLQDLYPPLRLPRLASTGYCPFWGLERQRAHTLVQQVELEMPTANAAKVRGLRLALLDSLRAVLNAQPLDSVTLGQLTRYAIDASRIELALPVVRSCAATRVFCLELEARLVYADGRLPAADSLFSAARAARRTGCDAGLSYLLADFENVFDPCDAAALSQPQQEQLWWAADPLWTTPYNERRIEHERRRLDHAMRLQVGRDEFLDYTRESYTPSALAFHTRYGQATAFRTRADHRRLDRNPNRSLWFQGETPDKWRPIGAFNFSLDRVATIPPRGVWNAPQRTEAGDWMLATYGADRFRNPWPAEHARFPFSLATSTSVQVARFRRDGAQLLVAATAPPPSWQVRDAEQSTGVWMSSPGTRVVQHGSVDGVHMAVPCEDGVLSFESERTGSGAGDAAWWRVRTGISTLPQCTDRKALSVSDLLVTVPRLARSSTLGAIPLSRVRPSLTLRRDSAAVGLFFEVYGTHASDSLSVTLAFRSRSQGGPLTWLTDALVPGSGGRVRDGSIAWRVPADTDPRVQPRSVTTDLDMRAAPPGRYDLTISIETAGGRAVSATRTIEIVP